ncbi:MAG: mycothiol synthase [Candidatus Nanopelagicales bacterium]
MTPHSIETSRHLAPGAKTELRELGSGTQLSDQALALVVNAPEDARETDTAQEKSDGLFLVARDGNGGLHAAGVVDTRMDPPVAEFVADLGVDNPVDWVQLVFDELANNPPAPSVVTWDHGADTATGRLAQARGWPVARQLVIMEKPLNDQIEQSKVPDGWQLRSFSPETDEDTWLDLNRQAFADLPDQAAWTVDDLRARYQEDWFNEDGFLLLFDREGTLRGAHWTKQEGAVGEVYVLAVAPGSEGLGLGALLTNAGLSQLADEGAIKVQLYVDAKNVKALALYRKLGFTELARDTQYLAGLGHV